MAGRRQHYIPRFLLKGFVSKTQKDQYYTFVYRKNRPAFECNLINIGLEIDFYGNPKDSKADRNITESEKCYSNFIENIKKLHKKTTLNSVECADFLSHVLKRGKIIRTSIQEIGETFYSATKEKIIKFPDQESFLLHLIKTNRKKIAKNIMAKLPSNLSHKQKILLTKYCLDNPKKWLEQFSGKDLSELIIMFDGFIENMPKITKASHIRAIEDITILNGINNNLLKFQWFLLYQVDSNYIFGDVGPICWNRKNKKFKNILFINQDIKWIFMPLSKNHLLIGQKTPILRVIPEVSKINEAIAKLSREFFVCHSINQETERLSAYIGSEANEVGEDEKIILDKILSDLST